MYYTGSPKKRDERRKKRGRKIFEEILAQNFPILMKH